jgi:hypothetical protein
LFVLLSFFLFEKYNIALEYAKIWRRRHIKHKKSAYSSRLAGLRNEMITNPRNQKYK